MLIQVIKIKQWCIAVMMDQNFQNLVFPPGVWNYTDFDSYIKQIIGNDEISLTFDARKCHAQKSLNSNVKNDGRRTNVQFVLFKNKIYLFDVQQLLLYEVLGV